MIFFNKFYSAENLKSSICQCDDIVGLSRYAPNRYAAQSNFYIYCKSCGYGVDISRDGIVTFIDIVMDGGTLFVTNEYFRFYKEKGFQTIEMKTDFVDLFSIKDKFQKLLILL